MLVAYRTKPRTRPYNINYYFILFLLGRTARTVRYGTVRRTSYWYTTRTVQSVPNLQAYRTVPFVRCCYYYNIVSVTVEYWRVPFVRYGRVRTVVYCQSTVRCGTSPVLVWIRTAIAVAQGSFVRSFVRSFARSFMCMKCTEEDAYARIFELQCIASHQYPYDYSYSYSYSYS